MASTQSFTRPTVAFLPLHVSQVFRVVGTSRVLCHVYRLQCDWTPGHSLEPFRTHFKCLKLMDRPICQMKPRSSVAVLKDYSRYLLANDDGSVRVSGSIKVWDFGSGQLYKTYPDEQTKRRHEDTITGLVYHTMYNKRCLLVSSWGKKIRIMEDSAEVATLIELKVLTDLFIPPVPSHIDKAPYVI
ncbi:WD repeat-containing protein 64 [Desmophyllum pertusum]|uniref:WD repeat-containing protein 64 n=1 Tax=Desmophyllum pertusum TaxID=174260 RepID=A0A9W9ZYF3_9CNID|nr:WD repeat-containing protein 64 [Desmophyllum pertusum]